MIAARTSPRLWMFGMAVAMLWTGGCKKNVPLAPAARLEKDALIETMRARPVPDPSQAKLSVKLRSKPLGIAAPPLGGGLIVDRPGKAYLAIMAPVGGPVLTLTSDGTGVAMMNARDKEYIVSADASVSLGSATEGQVQMDDLVSLLLGLVPVPTDSIRSRTDTPEGAQFVIAGPGGVQLTALIDRALGTPLRVDVDDSKGARVLEAVYAPFEPDAAGLMMPKQITLLIPAVEMTIDLKYRSWRTLETAPDVFTIRTPEGFTEVPFEAYVSRMAEDPPATDDDTQAP